MDAGTLYSVMGGVLPLSRYQQLVGPMNNAMIAANINNVNRAAMWCAQIGHESVSLKYMREIASGAEYEGRRDLGNTVKGDGVRYAGRGPIQLTGRANYGAFSRWAFSKGLVGSPTQFVDNPYALEDPHWGFLAASYYWTVARADINILSDRGDVYTVTRRINGGTNGLADRTLRWNRARPMGVRLLPTASGDNDMTPDQAARLDRCEAMLRMIYEQLAGPGADPFDDKKRFTGWPAFTADKTPRTLVDIGRRVSEQVDELRNKLRV